MVNVPELKGVHYAMAAGIMAADEIVAALRDGSTDLSGYAAAVGQSFITSDLRRSRNMKQPFRKGFFLGGAITNAMVATKGRFPGGHWETHRDSEEPVVMGGREASYPRPDGELTFDKLSSVYISGNATRDDAPNHIRVRRRVPRVLAETWRWMCPAGVYEIPDDAPADRRGRPHRQLHELRAVRGDHGEGRAPDAARRRRRAAVPHHIAKPWTPVRCSVEAMRRTALTIIALLVLAPPSPAAAGDAPRLRAVVSACETGMDPASRMAAFTASMPARDDTARMAIRFDLQQRTIDGGVWRRVAAPSFGRWERSRPDVAGLRLHEGRARPHRAGRVPRGRPVPLVERGREIRNGEGSLAAAVSPIRGRIWWPAV